MADDRFYYYQSASALSRGFKKNTETGMQEQGLGRSKAGCSKLHAACDALLGNPVRFFITEGQNQSRKTFIKPIQHNFCESSLNESLSG